MATTVLIPLSEYLSASYEVDCDFIEGEPQERNMGEWQHSQLQGLLFSIFHQHRREWRIHAGPEARVQVRKDRYRVLDLCIMRSSDPVHRIVRKAPLICIEVLSPEDRWQRIQERVGDYHRMGVEHVWILNPFKRDVWSALSDGSLQHLQDELVVPGTPIRIGLAELWAEFEDMQSIEA